MMKVENYGKGKDLYTWHIKQLEIFDEPKEKFEYFHKYGMVQIEVFLSIKKSTTKKRLGIYKGEVKKELTLLLYFVIRVIIILERSLRTMKPKKLEYVGIKFSTFYKDLLAQAGYSQADMQGANGN